MTPPKAFTQQHTPKEGFSMCPASTQRRRYDNCVFGTFYTLTIQALYHILRLIYKRYYTIGLPPLLHLFDSINVRKSEVLHQPAPETPHTAPTILLNGTPLNVATTSAAFGRLLERLWKQTHQACNTMQGLQCYHPIMFSEQFRHTHALWTSYSASVTNTPTPLTSQPRNQVVRPSDQQ